MTEKRVQNSYVSFALLQCQFGMGVFGIWDSALVQCLFLGWCSWILLSFNIYVLDIVFANIMS